MADISFTDILTDINSGYDNTPKIINMAQGGEAKYAPLIKKLKEQVKQGNLSQADFDRLSFDPKDIPRMISKSRADDWYGISEKSSTNGKSNKKLFNFVKKIGLGINKSSTGMHFILKNPNAYNKLVELVKQGTKSEEVLRQLRKIDNFPPQANISQIVKALTEIDPTGKFSKFKLDPKYQYVPGIGVPRFVIDKVKANLTKILDEGARSGNMPSLKDVTEKVGYKRYGSISKYIKEIKGVNFFDNYFADTTITQANYINKLANDLDIQEGFKTGKIFEPKYIDIASKLINKDPSKVRSILSDTSLASQGKKKYKNLKAQKVITSIPKLGQKGIDVINKERSLSYGGGNRGTDDLDTSNQIGEKGKFFDNTRRKFQKTAQKVLKNLGITEKVGTPGKGGIGITLDEIFNIAAGARGRGGGGSSILGQAIAVVGDKDNKKAYKKNNLNARKGNRVDQLLSNLKQKSKTQKITPDEIRNFNKQSKIFTEEINKTLPKGAKKLKTVTLVPNGNPIKTMPDIYKFKKDNPKLYNNIIDTAKKDGFSIRIPRGTSSMYDFGDSKKAEKMLTDNLVKTFKARSPEDLKKKIKVSSPDDIIDVFKKNPIVMADPFGMGTAINYGPQLFKEGIKSLSKLTPAFNALGKAKPVLRGVGKAAMIIDPMFAAMDFSKAQEEGLSTGQSGIFAGRQFLNDIGNLPRTLEDLAHVFTKDGTFKNFGNKKNRLLNYDKFTGAQDYFKRKIDETPTATKDYRKANLRYDQSMPTFYDDIEIADSAEDQQAQKDAYLKNQGVTRPKKEGITSLDSSFFTNPHITGTIEDDFI
jgi:hypothetical protein